MKIIIVGAGVIGANLAKELTEEGHEVYLIESNEATANKIREKLDVKVAVGSGSDPEVLKEVGAGDADLVIAVTTSDETNLVVCSLAASLGTQQRIARVRKRALSREVDASGYTHFYVDEIINPEQVAAQAIVKTVRTPGAKDVADFADGRILLRSFDITPQSALCDLKISDIAGEDFPWPFLITFIIRAEQVLVPTGETQILAGDLVYVLLPAASLGEFLGFVNPAVRMPKKVVVYGASDIGCRVVMTLAPTIRDLILLEDDPARAEQAAGILEGTRIINGSATETDILIEAGIEAADAFISATDNDLANLVSAVLAKKMGARSTIIITQQPDYLSIVDALDIDAVINPRLLAVHQILTFVRGKGVHSVTKLLECDAEALELIPEAGSAVTRAPIKKLSFPRQSIIGAVSNGSEVFLANGDTHIRAGERVIVFCQQNAVARMQKMFINKTLF